VTQLHVFGVAVTFEPGLAVAQAILHRIQTREPHYNHLKWEEDRLANEKYLKNIQEYKRSASETALGRPGGASRMATGVLAPDELDPEYARESRERLAAAAEMEYGDDGMEYPVAGGRGGTLKPLRS
jgi:hypothetical protein